MNRLIAAFILLGAAPALAQPLTTTQDPPAGRSSESTPNTTNSVPRAAGTERPTQQPGANIGSTAPVPAPVPTAPAAPSK